jgi:hypothetical protein
VFHISPGGWAAIGVVVGFLLIGFLLAMIFFGQIKTLVHRIRDFLQRRRGGNRIAEGEELKTGIHLTAPTPDSELLSRFSPISSRKS